jgi:hypothetical protein
MAALIYPLAGSPPLALSDRQGPQQDPMDFSDFGRIPLFERIRKTNPMLDGYSFDLL